MYIFLCFPLSDRFILAPVIAGDNTLMIRAASCSVS
nr:MAG TPA: hypothetical protein [Caudoviricetes sp.]